MAGETRDSVLLKDIQTLFRFGVVRDLSDRQLLEQFLSADQADAEAAFTFLVERHGPMVLHVCRQVLDDSHDAQDAFQATFLVFLRRTRSIRKHDSLASWLFGVAVRVARRARYNAILRRFHEQRAGELAAACATPTNGHPDRVSALHEEIARLPERYREPIVLCHLEGLSTAAAAQRLGCAHGTILSRLARARERLRRRLTQRGRVEFAGLFVAAQVLREATVALSPALVNSTVQAAVHAQAGRTALTAIVAPSVVALTQSTLRTLFMTRITLVAALLTTATVMTALAVPFIGPTLGVGSQAPSTDKETRANQEKPRPIEQMTVQSRDLEDALYQILKRDREFNHPRWPFVIKVRDVQGKTLIDATFTHRTKGKDNEFDAEIQAKRGVLRFDLGAKIVRVSLEDVEGQNLVRNQDFILIKCNAMEFPIPLNVEQSFPARAGHDRTPKSS